MRNFRCMGPSIWGRTFFFKERVRALAAGGIRKEARVYKTNARLCGSDRGGEQQE